MTGTIDWTPDGQIPTTHEFVPYPLWHRRARGLSMGAFPDAYNLVYDRNTLPDSLCGQGKLPTPAVHTDEQNLKEFLQDSFSLGFSSQL
jgi:hypothetical protein